MNKNFLIIDCIFGLGNRLRALASAYSICRKLQIPLIILWQPDFHCNTCLRDIIENEEFIIYDKPFELPKDTKIYNYNEKEKNANKSEYIHVTTSSKIYVKSNCVLNNQYSYTYFLIFLRYLLSSLQYEQNYLNIR